MRGVFLIVSLMTTFVHSVPLYGKDGGYSGFASYKPLKRRNEEDISRNSLNKDNSASKSPDISRWPASSIEDSSHYDKPKIVPGRISPDQSFLSIKDSSHYENSKEIPNRIKEYRPPSAGEASSPYEEPVDRPNSINGYRPPSSAEDFSLHKESNEVPNSGYKSPSSIEDSSQYGEPNEVPNRINKYSPPSSAEDSFHYKVPNRINAYRPSSSAEDSSHYEEPKKIPNRANTHQPPPTSAEVSSQYPPRPPPKKYDVSEYNPSHHHGYNGNQVSEGKPNDPYHHATIYGQSGGGFKIADTYQNHQADSKDDISYPQPYEFGYAMKDVHGNAQHRHEASDGHGTVKGTYGFTDAQGIYRSVKYIADEGGFRASIMTNEPGTGGIDPANIRIKADTKIRADTKTY